MAEPITEGRKHQRYATHIPVAIYCYRDEERREIIEGHISNISEGGAHINCALPLDIDRKILIRFLIDQTLYVRAIVPFSDLKAEAEASLPSGISPHAVICWGDVKTGFGVQFVELDESRKELIRTLVEKVAAGKFPAR